MEKENLPQLLIKDLSDFYRATGNKPAKILVRNEIFSYLKDNNHLETGNGDAYKFEGILLSKTDNINKDWIVV